MTFDHYAQVRCAFGGEQEGPLREGREGGLHFLSSPESRCQQNAPCDGCRWCRAARE